MEPIRAGKIILQILSGLRQTFPSAHSNIISNKNRFKRLVGKLLSVISSVQVLATREISSFENPWRFLITPKNFRKINPQESWALAPHCGIELWLNVNDFSLFLSIGVHYTTHGPLVLTTNCCYAKKARLRLSKSYCWLPPLIPIKGYKHAADTKAKQRVFGAKQMFDKQNNW